MKINILLAAPRGYCAGVNRAIEIVDQAIKKYGTPLYVNHEIIHNKFIIEHFKKKGVIFGEEVKNIKEGNIIIFSAHGVGPLFIESVKKQKLKYIDASCPLVIKVHKEAQKFLKEGHEIIYIGKKGHQEAEGIVEEQSDKIHIVSSVGDVEKIIGKGNTAKYALLTQTTLSVQETQDLIKKVQALIPDIILPAKEDICYATTNRQEAVTKISEQSDILIVVGSKNSSNSSKLQSIGKKMGITSLLIDSYKELEELVSVPFMKGDYGDSCCIGVSGGASAPEHLIQEVVEYLKSLGEVDIKKISLADEKMVFPFNIDLQG